eukprot:gene10860-8476_t
MAYLALPVEEVKTRAARRAAEAEKGALAPDGTPEPALHRNVPGLMKVIERVSSTWEPLQVPHVVVDAAQPLAR